MTDLPEPLVPADVDLRNLDGFMLNVERLIASELWALSTGDEFKAAMGLWCRAWKQFPAGSLPDDEKVLAAFSGAGKAWPKVRAMAMRGFVKCKDGRWYHRVLCEDVKRAALKKQERHERTKAATEARKKQRHDHRNDERDVKRDDPQNINVTTSHRQDRDRTGTIITGVECAREIHQRILALIPGTENLPKLHTDWPLVEEWLKAGADPDRDIIPTIERLLIDTPRPRTLKFFTEAVIRAKADREAIAQEFTDAATRPGVASHSSQRRGDTGIEALAILRRSRESDMGGESAGAA